MKNTAVTLALSGLLAFTAVGCAVTRDQSKLAWLNSAIIARGDCPPDSANTTRACRASKSCKLACKA